MEFDTKFVYYMWDVELEGKEAFYSDNIDSLRHYVQTNDQKKCDRIHFSFDESAPFATENELSHRHFKFVYCDPHYKLKWAHEHGERIEALASFGKDVWFEIENPTWDFDPSRYRIKKYDDYYGTNPKIKLVTNRELSEWLNLGNGECLTPDRIVSTVWTYHVSAENDFVDLSVRIRKWDSDRWLPLTKENLLVSMGCDKTLALKKMDGEK